MWEKIETFLFDLMGLLLPGIVFLVGIFFTSLLLFSSGTFEKIEMLSKDIPFFITLLNIFNKLNNQISLLILLFLLHAYLTGHVIKVFSKIYYSIFGLIFDKGINKMIVTLKNKGNIDTAYLTSKFPSSFETFLNDALKIISNLSKETFVYIPKDYEPANEKFLDESMVIINRKFETDFPKEWYSFYKLAKIIISHEDLKSMNDTFLAKYNLYRSLSFITFLQIITIVIFNISSVGLNSLSGPISLTLILINIIFWYTFHEKYKRYYRLCGNEILVAVYYHFKKETMSN